MVIGLLGLNGQPALPPVLEVLKLNLVAALIHLRLMVASRVLAIVPLLSPATPRTARVSINIITIIKA